MADVLNTSLTPVDHQPDRNPTPSDTGTKIKPPADVQAAITVLGRLPSRHGMSRGDLIGAYLAGAVLFTVNLTDLTGAMLLVANLTNADLREANLTTAKNLTQQQLESA